MPAPACGSQHFSGILNHRGGELPGTGRGSSGAGPEEDAVVCLVEGASLPGPVLHAGEHLLERPSLPQNQS